MTATVRLTKQAAERFASFLSGLKNQPRNINDALNLALADLPRNSFIDEIWQLQTDKRQSIVAIKSRFDQTGFLKRSDYYFMIMIAREACSLKKVNRIQRTTFQNILRMTLDLWRLCKKFDPEGHFERYMLGNVGGNSLDGGEENLENYLHKYMDQPDQPFSLSLEFALRNPEVMLRDELANISDMQINNTMLPYFPMLYRIGARWHYLTTNEPLTQNNDHYNPNRIWKNFGKGKLSFSQYDNQNVGFALSGTTISGVVLVANNIIDIEEYLYAFVESAGAQGSYSGKVFTLHRPSQGSSNDRYIFMTSTVLIHLPHEEYNIMADLLSQMSKDPDVKIALDLAKAKFGEI
jgi:hypothetical protein